MTLYQKDSSFIKYLLSQSSKTPIWGSWGTLKPPSNPEQEGRDHQEIEAAGCRILRRWEARATLRLVHVGRALPRGPGRKALPWKRHPCERSGMARWTFLRSEKEKEKRGVTGFRHLTLCWRCRCASFLRMEYPRVFCRRCCVFVSRGRPVLKYWSWKGLETMGVVRLGKSSMCFLHCGFWVWCRDVRILAAWSIPRSVGRRVLLTCNLLIC